MVDSDLWRRAKVLLELAVRKSTTVSGMVGPSATTEQPDSEFSPLRPSLVGRMLGRYRLEEQIGAGGMGEVYRAHDERLNRVVAVKVIAPNFLANAQARERFEQEAQAIAALSHPNICILYDAASIDGVEFLVIEHLEGETLAARIVAGGGKAPSAIRDSPYRN